VSDWLRIIDGIDMRRLALVMAALLLFAACGGGDDGEASLEGYFADLETASIAYDEAAAATDAVLNESTDPLKDTKEAFPAFVDDLRAFVTALEGLTPSAEVAAQHADTVTDGRAVLAALEALVADLEYVEDPPGLGAFYEGPALAALVEAGDQFSDGCAALQSIADAEEIEVDLRCG